MSALRTARAGLQLLGGRAASAHGQQSSGFSSLALGSWWHGTGSAAAAPDAAAALGWRQAAAALLPQSLLDGTWLAVPKKKVSPHRRGNRNAGKFIRFVPVVSECSQCGRIFQQHSLPHACRKEECPAFNLRERPERQQAADAAE